MPPVRIGRASKACDACRKQKTRCYESDNPNGTCLRCETLSTPCSLVNSSPTPYLSTRESRALSNIVALHDGQSSRNDDRLDRLEQTVKALVKRIDSNFDPITQTISTAPVLSRTHDSNDSVLSEEPNSAPVFLIRDVANDVGVRSPEQSHKKKADILSKGLISLTDTYNLLTIFQLHYGRWVRFDDSLTIAAVLEKVRESPLLLSSICLIAVRHTSEKLADRLGPVLFEEAKRLVSSGLLVVPQPIEFFQAVLILSLWSTTIGQLPLSVDSWLLTGYALQQSLASPCFADSFRANERCGRRGDFDAWCIWIHICLAHLQYCVGTRRQALLNKPQIEQFLRVFDHDGLNNFEARMVAEIRLYWIMYENCCNVQVDTQVVKSSLETWRKKYASLFDQPRAQFLSMGFHFAQLLAHCQSLRSSSAVMRGSVLKDMTRLSSAIIELAMETADERTKHLTDHIYHIITFAAITLCRLLHTYENKLLSLTIDVTMLDTLIIQLVKWLRTIGLPCHVAHILGDVVSAHHKKLRPRSLQQVAISPYTTVSSDGIWLEQQNPDDLAFLYPGFIEGQMFDINADASLWPQWDHMVSDGEMSV